MFVAFIENLMEMNIHILSKNLTYIFTSKKDEEYILFIYSLFFLNILYAFLILS